jgi:hypothetical protein
MMTFLDGSFDGTCIGHIVGLLDGALGGMCMLDWLKDAMMTLEMELVL